MTEVLRTFVFSFDWLVLVFLIAVVVTYGTTTLLAMPTLLRYRRWSGTFHPDEESGAAATPPITLIAPMYNEEAVCVEAVRAFLNVSYPMKEIIVVDDGSKDGTLARLTEAFSLVPTTRPQTAWIETAEVEQAYRSERRPDLWVIRKANGGRSDAINVGFNHSRCPLVCVLDGDSILAPDGLHRVVRPFLEDATTVAAGGTIGIVNDCTVRFGRVSEVRMPTSWVARFQVLEYIRAFAASRVGWNAASALPLISGAFGLFRRQAVVMVGGLDPDTVGEDFELTMKLHRYHIEHDIPYRIDFVPDAISWTECPDSLDVLGRQRDRWQRGGLEVIRAHRKVLLNPRYGRVGMFSFPAMWFVELMAPIVEAIGYVAIALAIWLGLLQSWGALLLLAMALAMGMAQSVASIALEQFAFRRYTSLKDVLLLLLLVLLENLGYRQLTVWWRIKGTWKFFRGDNSWGEMKRTGFTTAPS
ncbi:MAG: glycosyltransferase [Bacteroidota bacterium]